MPVFSLEITIPPARAHVAQRRLAVQVVHARRQDHLLLARRIGWLVAQVDAAGYHQVHAAALDELPADQEQFLALNAELSREWPVITEMKDPPEDADEWREVKDKLKYLER